MKEKIHNIFYKITNQINNKFYYGIHSTNNLNDNYMGGGTLLRIAIKKYGIENFKKEILFDFPTRKQASDCEKQIVIKELVDNKTCYNLQLGGDTIKPVSEYTRELLSKKSKGRNLGKTWEEIHGKTKAAEMKKAHSEFILQFKKFTFKGKKHSAESKKKIQLKSSGENNFMYGKTHSTEIKEFLRKINTGVPVPDERKQRISNSLKGRKISNKTKERMSLGKIGRPRSRPCMIESIFYENIKIASQHVNVCYDTVKKRLKSNDELWKNWHYVVL